MSAKIATVIGAVGAGGWHVQPVIEVMPGTERGAEVFENFLGYGDYDFFEVTLLNGKLFRSALRGS
jgi:hypothetical protein